MILNLYSVVALFLCGVRLLLALITLVMSARLIWGGTQPADRRQALVYLVCYLVALQALFNVASWPVLYATLQSYVAQWPEVMCIYGVTQIGTGSVGVASYLPHLVNWIQIAKPLLVFTSGCWGVLYIVNRWSVSGALLKRMLTAALFVGLVSITDVAIESGYILIPKREEFAQLGCCSAAGSIEHDPSRLSAEAGEPDHRWSLWFLLTTAGSMAILLAAMLVQRDTTKRLWLLALPLWMAVAISVAAVFLVHVGAPTALGLPHHHCAYDLVLIAPEAAVAVIVQVFGWLLAFWAVMARLTCSVLETRTVAAHVVQRLLFLSLVAHLGAAVVWAIELAI